MSINVFAFGPLQTNAILIGCPETLRAAVIDPSPGSAGAVLAKAKELGLKIEKILLTHSHWDHFADAHALQERIDAPLYVHPLDAKNVEEPGSDGLPLFIPIQPARVDHLLAEGEPVEVGNLVLDVIHTPGHSPGGVCFYCKAKKLLISGDTLFKGSIGNLSLPTGEEALMWSSLEKLAKLPAETRVIPGHGKETIIGQETWLARAKEIFSE